MDAGNGGAAHGTSAIDQAAGKAPAPDVRTELLRMFPSIDGRIGRQRFIAYTVLTYAAVFIASFPLTLLTAVFPGEEASGAMVFITAAALAVWQLILLRRRLKDSNRALWETLLLIVPLLNIYIMFSPGTAGPNGYGPPPPATPAWLSIIVLLALIGVFAIALSEQR
jgi:uncharacterized membrane protein YhaH (DUF805 family)